MQHLLWIAKNLFLYKWFHKYSGCQAELAEAGLTKACAATLRPAQGNKCTAAAFGRPLAVILIQIIFCIYFT